MSGKEMPEKDPGDVLDYGVAWYLEAEETIMSSVWSVVGDVVKGQELVAGNVTTVWLSGGTPGMNAVTNRITTSAGRVYERTLYIKVKNL